MSNVTMDTLRKASASGGGHVITGTTEMRSAEPSGLIFPPTIPTDKRGVNTYLGQTRVTQDGSPVSCVVVDSKASHINRAEAALLEEINTQHPVFSLINHIRVQYPDRELTDLEVPGKIADTHIKLSTLASGNHLDTDPLYIQATTENPGLYKALLQLSAGSALSGFWESRRSGGAKVASLFRGETYAELADQTRDINTGYFQLRPNGTGGVRRDPLSPKYDASVLAHVRDTMSNLTAGTMSTSKDRKEGPSVVGLGHVPISKGLGGVAARRIVRSTTISLPLLRRIKVSDVSEENVAARSALLALAIAVDALGAQDTHYRAGCDLVPVTTEFKIDDTVYETPTLDEAAELLGEAIHNAKGVVNWDGSVVRTTGDPRVFSARQDEDEDA